MSETASISTGIAQRYATAVYELAQEAKALPQIEKDLDALQAASISAIAKKMDLSQTLASTLELMANKRRLFVLPQLVQNLRDIIAVEKGEVTADVISAKALTKAQSEKLSKSLAATTGKKVTLNATVDDSLIGGLIVKVGSKMIDTSIRAKLNSLQNVMKEVG